MQCERCHKQFKGTHSLCEECRKSEEALVEGKDYYLENGFFVFTEAYHLKRGYCCGSGCRHCPWK